MTVEPEGMRPVRCVVCGEMLEHRRWALIDGLVLCAGCIDSALVLAYDRMTEARP